jgi:transposase
MGITITDHETINSQSMKSLFIELKLKYPDKPKIHLILDRGAYNTSKETRASSKEYGVILHHLPPYSPNLNPIERLWKVMNEYARNNKVFKTAKEFRKAILDFFTDTWPKISMSMTDTINDNFQNIGKLPQNQRPPSKDGGLTIGLKAGPVDKSTCFSSSHTLNPSGTSD